MTVSVTPLAGQSVSYAYDANNNVIGLVGFPTILNSVVPLDKFSPVTDGTADVKAAFRQAISEASGNKVRRVRIRAGDYRFDVAGDADSIVVPSNVVLEFDEGATCYWDYFGSPLFTLGGSINAGIVGAKFVWSGTYMVPAASGSRSFKGSVSLPSLEWCAHIDACGANRFILEDLESAGLTTANTMNNFIHLGFMPNGTTKSAYKSRIRRIKANDVSQGVLGGGVSGLEISGLSQERYSVRSNGSISPDPLGGQYGPGHLIYITHDSDSVVIDDVNDLGATRIEATYQGGDHTLSLKGLKRSTVTRIRSGRDEGMLNFNTLENVEFSGLVYETSSTNADSSGGIFASASATPIRDVSFDDVHLRYFQSKNVSPVNLSALASGADNVRMTGKISILRNISGAESNAALTFVGSYADLKLNITELSSTGKAHITSTLATSTGNKFELTLAGLQLEYVQGTFLGTNNIVTLADQAANFYGDGADANTSTTAANGNVITRRGGFRSKRSIATSTTPSTTIQLPKKGSYTVECILMSGDRNHAISARYYVLWDDASANDFTVSEQMGTTATKGSTLSLPTLSVSNAGVVTFGATSSPTQATTLFYGYTANVALDV